MKLKLSELANIAEVIGAFAVVISLLYVGVQVSDNTRAMRSATASVTSDAIPGWYGDLGGNLQASTIMLDGISNPESLSRRIGAVYISGPWAIAPISECILFKSGADSRSRVATISDL